MRLTTRNEEVGEGEVELRAESQCHDCKQGRKSSVLESHLGGVRRRRSLVEAAFVKPSPVVTIQVVSPISQATSGKRGEAPMKEMFE